MTLEKLSSETVNTTFRYLERKGRYTSFFVSKQWHNVVKPIYYQEVTIANGSFGYLLQQLFLQDNSLVDFGSFEDTQKLTIYDLRCNTSKLVSCFRPDEVIALLSFFRNIKVLKINECVYKQSLIEKRFNLLSN